MAADILEKIVARKYEELEVRYARTPLDDLKAMAGDQPASRGFADALVKRASRREPAVIAEIKRASPSKGVIREHFVPTEIAASYEAGGAACLSVLTDEHFFQGSDDYLVAARATVQLPVLRKDFTVEPYQVVEAKALGADCILLIASILTTDQLQALAGLATELGMDVLVEVHDSDEIARAVTAQPRLLGINNRDLRTFETRLETTYELAGMVPVESLIVTESGIHTAADVSEMMGREIYAFLVGEAFMRAEDPGMALRSMFFEPA